LCKIEIRISEIEVIPVRVPIDFYYASSMGIRGDSEFVLVRLISSDGLVGYGEASLEYNWLNGETQESAITAIDKYISRHLKDEKIISLNLALRKINNAIAGNLYAKAAVDIALHDLVCKHLGIPLFEYFGGLLSNEVEVKFNIPITSSEVVARLSKEAREKGFKTIKLKVGLDERTDLSNLQTIRSIMGYDVKIGVDANGAWNPKQAVRIIKKMEEFDLLFVEQPVPRWSIDGLKYVAQHVTTPVMADESISTPYDAIKLVKSNAVHMFSVYIGKAGGINEARKILHIAEGAGIDCTIGSNIELGIGNAAKLHVAASSSIVTIAPDIAPWFYTEDVITPKLECINGKVKVPEGEGLGIRVDEDKIEKYRVKI
jgi:L-alanine-DL-glutamate epimerase-like enolase superfamily enzyme